jgi:Ankyrin repeats (3 copies)
MAFGSTHHVAILTNLRKSFTGFGEHLCNHSLPHPNPAEMSTLVKAKVLSWDSQNVDKANGRFCSMSASAEDDDDEEDEELVSMVKKNLRLHDQDREEQEQDDATLEEEDLKDLARRWLISPEMMAYLARLKAGRAEVERWATSLFIARCVTNEHDQVQATLAEFAHLTKFVDARGDTALILAAIKGHLPIVKLLHQNGAELNHANAKGRTALMEAALWGRLSVACYLLEKGADYTLRDRRGHRAEDFATADGQNVRRRKNYSPSCAKPTKDHYIILSILSILRARAPSPALPRVPVMPSRYTRFSSQGTTTILVSDVAEWDESTFKTIGVLFRDGDFPPISAKSGWAHVEVPASQGGLMVLGGKTWTEKVFDLTKRLRYQMMTDLSCDQGRPGAFYACHAEKQLMAYFISKHAFLPDETDPTSEHFLPPPGMLKTAKIITSREMCPSCKEFRDMLKKKLGITFEVSYQPRLSF